MNATRLKAGVLCSALLLVVSCGRLDGMMGEEDNTAPPAELVDIPSPISIEEVWSRDVGAGPEELFLQLNVAVSGGRVYAADRKGTVSAFDQYTGERLWETNTKRSIGGGPGVGAGLVLVGTREGRVIALSPVTGERLWKARVTSEVLSAPQARNGVVIVRTVDGKLIGLNAIDGERLWIYDRGVPALTLRGTSTPAVTDTVAVSGFDGGRVVAVALDSGLPLWETRVVLPSGRSELERLVDIDGRVVIDDRTVYVVSFQGRTAALDLDSGTILWRRDMSSHAGLGLDENAVYVTDDQSHVWALDRNSSASIWRQTGLEARNLTAPVRIGDYVAVGDLEGYVHWLRIDDGELMGRVRVDKDGIITPPVAVEGTLFVYGRSGELVALRPRQTETELEPEIEIEVELESDATE